MATLLSTNANLEPNYVGYKLGSVDIESYISEYLEGQGIDGIHSSVLIVNKEGNGPNIGTSFFIFFDPSSKDISVSRMNMPDAFKKKIGVGNYNASQKLQKALGPLVPWGDHGPEVSLRLHKEKGKEMVYVKCNIFKVLSLMLDAPSKHFQINIMNASNTKKGRSVLTVIKSVKASKNIDTSDVFRTAASKLK